MYKDKYTRLVQGSVTNFLYHGDEYLFLKRSSNKRIDPNRLNGIGGKLEPKEDFLACAIRETEEETGYKVTPQDIQLATVAKLEGGYEEDWIMCFFKIKVHSKKIPNGHQSNDGELMWIHKDRVLDTKFELIDDLNYVFKDIVEGNNILFFNAQMDSKEKIENINISRLPLKKL